MKAYVGVTDVDWYRQLSSSGDELQQVNFWSPGGNRAFSALRPGELFLFKTRVRDGNQIVGGGIFDAFVFMRIADAWDLLGPENGVRSLDQFRDRVRRYRRTAEPLPFDAQIGCILLRDVRFFSDAELMLAPSDFHPNVVQGKAYDLDTLPSDHPVLVAAAQLIMPGLATPGVELPWELRQRMFGDARLVVPRLGQDAFKAVIASNYHHHCAITGDKVRPVLEAAHIRPVAAGGMHRSDNGILLRVDMHRLFDKGYLGFDTKRRLQVSPLLRSEFGNGDALYAKQGTTIDLPQRRVDQPNVEYLEWHMDTVFKRSA